MGKFAVLGNFESRQMGGGEEAWGEFIFLSAIASLRFAFSSPSPAIEDFSPERDFRLSGLPGGA